MNTLLSYDLTRAIALMPIQEDKSNKEEWLKHRRGNIIMLGVTLVLMTISLGARWDEIPTHSFHPANSPLHIIDNIATGELFFLQPLCYMWVISLGLMLLQRWEFFQHPIKKKRGRPQQPRAKVGDNPWKNDSYRIALESVLNALGKGIGSRIAGIILRELIENRAFAKNYNQKSLANWLYNRYREYFDDFKPKSMTTPSFVNEEVSKGISRLFESYINKHEIKEKKSKAL